MVIACFSASLGASFFITEDFNIRSNVGTAWRPPNISELYSQGLHHGAAAIEEGNQSLQSEKAVKWITSFQVHQQKLFLEISPYWNYIQNYIYLKPTDIRLTIRGAFPVFEYIQTNAHFWGVDADVKYHILEELFWNSKLSFLRASDAKYQQDLVWIPPNRLENGLTFEKKQWGELEDTYISFSFAYIFQQHLAPQAIDDIENIPDNTDENFDFMEAPPAYGLFKLALGTVFPFKNQSLSLHVSIDNLLNTAYRDYMNRFRYYADAVGRNVTVRLKYSFF